MGGYANVDDDVFEVPGGLYRGVAPRSFDAKSQQWSIWWIDSRTPLARLDPPVRGRFQNGVGTLYADDIENGKAIRIRFIWSKITPTSCHWEQPYSPDGGKTWETNWVQDLTRVQQIACSKSAPGRCASRYSELPSGESGKFGRLDTVGKRIKG